MTDNCIQAIKRLLTSLNIKHTTKYLRDSILSHPNHPSLLSISDTLDKYHIETLAVRINAKKLNNVPLPCITQVEVNKQYLFFVLQNISDNEVIYYNDKSKLIKSPKEEFLNQWTGVCLLAETTENTKEKNIKKKILAKQVQNFLITIITVMLLIWIGISFLSSEVITSKISVTYLLFYTILKVIGLTVGVFLLWFEIDQFNPTLQKFCSGGSSKINCNSVLNSKHAKLFNDSLSISLLSFTYFLATLIYLIISGFSFNSLSILGVLSFMTLPAIIASIYYQAIVIKQWCKFCIMVQAVLVSEICITIAGNFYNNNIFFELIPLLVALLLLPIVAWEIIKPLIDQNKESNLHKRGLKKIKNNPNVLESLLLKSRKISSSSQGLGISLQNKNAKYNIIKVCNPYCGPCAKAHPVLEDLVNTGKINLQILFTTNGTDAAAEPVSHFLAIDAQGAQIKTQTALDDWYNTEKKDYDVFSKKHPLNGELKQQNDKIKAMSAWCDTEKITHTPTIFINGYELPKEYSVEDLEDVLQ